MSKHGLELCSTKREVVSSTPLTEAKARFYRADEKENKLFDWLQLNQLPYLEKCSWLFVTGCPYVFVFEP